MTGDAQLAFDLRDEGIARAEAADLGSWDARVIDHAIRRMLAEKGRFSANDLRHLLPEVRRPVIGARILAAINRKQIKRVSDVVSTDPGTHGKRIGVYERTVRP